jgi:4-amino-4-deoxy-L-arabinose transferase-like glycosyltransferase
MHQPLDDLTLTQPARLNQPHRIERNDSPSTSSGAAPVWYALAGLIVFFSLCFGLGHLPLLQPDEGRNAEVAREMKHSGAWLVPTYNGVDYLDKPAFYFKAVALSLAAFGTNETAARLPSSLFGVALVVMTWAFCRRVYGSARLACLAAIVTATMPLFFAHARIVIFDMALAFFVCGAIFAGFLAEEAEGRPRRNWYLLASAAAGLATLVKGPVGFLIPMLVLLAVQPLLGRRGAWKRLLAPLNWVVFFAVALPWFVGLCLKRPDFLHYGLVQESFQRFTDTKAFHRGKPFYYYALIVAGTFFPWSLLLPEAVLVTWRLRLARHRADLLCVVWSLLTVLFFSISRSKQPAYILSVCVSCGILVARMCDAAMADPQGRLARLLRRGTLALGTVCLAGLVAMIWAARHPAKVSPLLPALSEDVPTHAWLMAASLAAVLAISVLGILRRNVSACFLSLAVLSPLLVAMNYRGIDLAMAPRSARAAAELLGKLPADTEIASLECFPIGTPFYLDRTLTLISADGSELTSNYVLSLLKKPAPWPPNIVPVSEFETWLQSRSKPVYLIVRAGEQARLEAIASPRGAIVEPLTRRYCGALLPARGAH